MNSKSTRIMNVQLVLAACESFLDVQHQRLMAIQEPLIQRTMKPRLFGLIPGMTREQAKEVLGHDLWNKYNMAKLQNDWNSSHVLALRNLCLLPGNDGLVTLTAEDANILSKYFK